MKEGPIEHELCGGKNIYSKSEANHVRVAIGRGKHGRHADLRAYECPSCHGWHLTRKHRSGQECNYQPPKDHGRR